MEQLPGDVRVDAELLVEHLRRLAAESPRVYPRGFVPTITFEALLEKRDREPIHLHPSIHFLHRHWHEAELPPPPGGRRPRSRLARYVHSIVESLIGGYLQQEREFRAALAQSIDAVAYRIDEVATADARHLLEAMRDDLAALARYVEERTQHDEAATSDARETLESMRGELAQLTRVFGGQAAHDAPAET